MAKKQRTPNTEEVQQPNTFEFGIIGIKNLGFGVNESIQPGEQFNMSHSLNIKTEIEKESIEFTLGVLFSAHKDDPPFFTSHAATKFLVRDIKKYSNNNRPDLVTLPEWILHPLFSITYTHARAIQVVNAANTKFSFIILPVVNPGDLFDKVMHDTGLAKRADLASK